MKILRRLTPISLRNLVFLAMLIVVLAPVLFLLRQGEQRAFERELQIVEQGHLIIAENLSTALSRYAKDLVATFELVIDLQGEVRNPEVLKKILGTYNFHYIASLDVANNLATIVSNEFSELPSPDLIAELREEAVIDEPLITGVKRVGRETLLFVVQRDVDGRLFVGAFDTSYIATVQKTVAFGDRGHAMIVDKLGRVLAHPNPEWQETSKNVSGLDVVQSMISSQTGVTQFYSPALKSDMVAGYTYVTGPGWGVMVPQPIEELHYAAQVQAAKLYQTLFMLFLFAAAISWVLSYFISRPIVKLSRAAEKIRQGDFSARFMHSPILCPSELSDAGTVFNDLIDTVVENRAEIQSSLDAANCANDLKSKMISVLSHEMRTPLNGVAGAADLLQRTGLSNPQRKYLEVIQTSAKTLEGHVNDVLDLGGLESGLTQISRSTFDVRALLREIIVENEPIILRNAITVDLQTPDNQDLFVYSDAKLFRNIAANLIGNAAKFSEGGQVKVVLRQTQNQQLELRVSDTGAGIAQENLEKIFTPFTVLNSGFGRENGGTGLGLSIVASATKAIGGEYGVESESEKGSSFWVRFPISVLGRAATERRKTVKKQLRAQDSSTNCRRVLIVDDNEINRFVLAQMVESLGHFVSVATGGEEALELAMRLPFDLILMDIGMPDKDGTEVVKLLRENEGCNQSTVIIAQTAHASAKDCEHFQRLGMKEVLIKPIKLYDVERVLRGQDFYERTETGSRTYNREFLNTLDADQFEFLVEAKGYHSAVKTVREVCDQVEQIIAEIRESNLASEARTILSKEVHNISGACAVTGAMLLQKRLASIEATIKSGTSSSVIELVKGLEVAHKKTVLVSIEMSECAA